ncbi:MAG TPA: hypothetical protein VI997_02025 [Candidatus Thermoplasmatota archaeon]|nr:hypothetical protein [Candidatus Thermoplasmatota archaeon]
MGLRGSPYLVLFMLFVLAAPVATAQTPGRPTVFEDDILHIAVNVDDASFKEVQYLGTVTFQCSIEDLSRDSALEAPTGSGRGISHQVIIETEIFPYVPGGEAAAGNATNLTAPIGWAASGGTSVSTTGGQVAPFTIQVKTGGAVATNYVQVKITARGTAWGAEDYDEEIVLVKLAPYYAGRILMKEAPPHADQDATVTYPVEVTSFNSYPDAYLLNVTAPPGFFASVPGRIVMQPYETRVVNVTIVTPHWKLYDFGTAGTIVVTARSENEPKVVYTAATTVTVEGMYVAPYWIPILVLGLVAGQVLTTRSRERLTLRRGERGYPRHPRPNPREAALLAELKRRDRVAWKARMAQFAALHVERRREWKAHRKSELARERRERLESHREEKQRVLKEDQLRKARRTLDRAKAKEEARVRGLAAHAAKQDAKTRMREVKVERKRRKIQDRLDRKREKKEAKLRAKLEKELAKKRRKLEAAARKTAKELEKARKAAEKASKGK